MSEQSPIPGLTFDQYKLVMRLEEIFMPEARRQRIKANFGDETTLEPIRFIHYTSAAAALEIIKSKRIWMRNTTCMIDYKEVQHGLELMQKFFSESTRRDAFVSALDKCHSGAVSEAIALFDKRTADILLNTYVTSISEHDDEEDSQGRLSMWRAFGGVAARVGIVFRIPKFATGSIALNLHFSPVAYLTEPQVHKVMQEVTDNVNRDCELLKSIPRQAIIDIVFSMFQAAVVCLKHEGFREEREWRAIYSPQLRPSDLMKPSTQVINGIPQTVYSIPLDKKVSDVLADLDFAQIFDRLIIGPTAYPWAVGEAFVTALREVGVADSHDRVVASNIPIRA